MRRTNTMQRKLLPLVLTGLLTIGLASCATSVEPTSAPPAEHIQQEAARPTVDASVVRGGAQYDYEPTTNLPDLVDRTPVAVAGTVTEWAEGRSIIDGNDAERYAVLTLRVDTAAKTLTAVQEETIYVSVYRGTEALDDDGNPILLEGAPSSVTSVGELRRAVPEGTRGIVLGSPTVSVEEQEYAPYVTVVDANAGVPDGASLIDPWPQGLIFETSNGGFDGGIVDADELAGWSESAARDVGSDATRPEDAGSYENLLAQLGQFIR